MNPIFQKVIMDMALASLQAYQSNDLYQEGQLPEMDEVIRSFHDFVDKYDHIHSKNPIAAEKLLQYFTVELAIKYGFINTGH